MALTIDPTDPDHTFTISFVRQKQRNANGVETIVEHVLLSARIDALANERKHTIKQNVLLSDPMNQIAVGDLRTIKAVLARVVDTIAKEHEATVIPSTPPPGRA